MTQDPYAPGSHPSAAPSSYPSAAPAAYPPAAPGSYPSATPYDPSAQTGYEATAPLPSYQQVQQAQPAAAAYAPAGQSGGPAGAGVPTIEKRDGISALFDFGFKRFATPSLVKIVYILTFVLAILGWLGYALLLMMVGLAGDAFSSGYSGSSSGLGVVPGVLWLLFGWIPALLQVVLMRLACEFFVVQFRSHAQLREIKEHLQTRG